MSEEAKELETAIDKWDNDRIDLDPNYVEPIMDAARNWLDHLSKDLAIPTCGEPTTISHRGGDLYVYCVLRTHPEGTHYAGVTWAKDAVSSRA